MKILIIGAAGMVGRKLVTSLLRDPQEGQEALVLADAVKPEGFEASGGTRIEAHAVDISAPGTVDPLIAARPDVIIHLAAIVSGEAELDFEKGYAVNFDGMRELFEAVRAQENYCPKFVFASSIAVFGAPFPRSIPDDFFATPLTSYGTQKAMSELLLADYTRRGFLDGVGIRLPTICIRPGKPNLAASGFFSNILREPLAGREAVLPVSEDVRHWHASPRAAVGFFRHALDLDFAEIGPRRNLTMPGLSATVVEQIEALRRAAGDKAVALIRREPDEMIRTIVTGWPSRFEAGRALALGFRAETSFDEIIRVHLEDELS